MTQAILEKETNSARSLFDSTADLVTAKGVLLLFFLTGMTAVSAIEGRAVEGLVPGLVLTVLLVGSVAYERTLNDRNDAVGVVSVVLASAYTGLEYAGVNQGVWFPLSAAFVLLATAGYGAWKDDTANPAEFVEHLDVIGLHGGILFILYALLYAGAPLEVVYSPVFPAVLLFFALSLLVTTVAYAVRSPSLDVEEDELHHRLVSVVRSLSEIRDEEDRESLGGHVRSVAQALTGVHIPSRVEVSSGRVPVVLPVSGEPVFEADDIDDILKRVEEQNLTGYAVTDEGTALLVKNGEPSVYYVDQKDDFGTNPDVLPYGYFGDARAYSSQYTFVDAVEDVLPTGKTPTSEDGMERAETKRGGDEEKAGDGTSEKENTEAEKETPSESGGDDDISKKLDDPDGVFD